MKKILDLLIFSLFFPILANADSEWLYYKHYPWVYDYKSKDWIYLRAISDGKLYAYSSNSKEWLDFEDFAIGGNPVFQSIDDHSIILEKNGNLFWNENLDGFIGWSVANEDGNWSGYTAHFDNGTVKIYDSLTTTPTNIQPIINDTYEIFSGDILKISNGISPQHNQFFKISSADDSSIEANYGYSNSLEEVLYSYTSFLFRDLDSAQSFYDSMAGNKGADNSNTVLSNPINQQPIVIAVEDSYKWHANLNNFTGWSIHYENETWLPFTAQFDSEKVKIYDSLLESITTNHEPIIDSTYEITSTGILKISNATYPQYNQFFKISSANGSSIEANYGYSNSLEEVEYSYPSFHFSDFNSASQKFNDLSWDSNFATWIKTPDTYGGLDFLNEIQSKKDSNSSTLEIYQDQFNNTLEITNIEPIGYLTNLTTLHLPHYWNVEDFSPIAKLKALESLSFGWVNNLSFVSELKVLKALSVDTPENLDLTPLKNHESLSSIYLGWGNITDISGLSGLTNLDSLYMDMNQVSDLTPLSGLSILTRLNLNNNNISDITPLMELTNLTHLNLEGNPISESQIIKLMDSLPDTNIVW